MEAGELSEFEASMGTVLVQVQYTLQNKILYEQTKGRKEQWSTANKISTSLWVDTNPIY